MTHYKIFTFFTMISGRTSLHITTYKDHEGASVGGGGLTGINVRHV